MSGVPFVGRQRELSELLEAVAARRPVAVVGRRGMGRTRLSAEAADRATVEHACTVLRVLGRDAAARIPLGAMAEVIGAVRPTDSPATGAASPSDVPDRIVAAVRQLRDFAAERSALVVVDDAHLLDDASTTLLQQVAADREIGLLATCELVALDRCELVRAVWKDLDGLLVELGPLDSSEVHQLIVSFNGGPVDPSTAAKLIDLVGGNPLDVREVIAHLREVDGLRLQRGVWTWGGSLDPGARLRELVRERVGPLSVVEQTVVETLALAPSLPLATLRDVAASLAVESLERRGVIGVGPAPDHLAELVDALDAAVIAAGVATTTRARLSTAVADSLDGRGTRPEHRVRAALLRLGTEHRPDTATLTAAATEALGMAAPADALRLAEAAVEGGGGAPATVIVGEALVLLGRPTDADAHLSVLDPGYLDDRLLVRLGRARIDALAHGLGKLNDAAAVVEALAAHFEDGVQRDRLQATWASALAIHGRHDEALGMADGLLSHRDLDVRLGVWPAVNLSLIHRGAAETAAHGLEQLLEGLAEQTPDPIVDVDPSIPMSLLIDYVLAGRLGDAELLADKIAIATSPGQRGGSPVYLDVVRGKIALLQGRVATAEAHLRAVLVAHEQIEAVAWRGWAIGLLAEACALTGRVEEAAALADEAEATMEMTPMVFVSDVRRGLAWVTALAGAPSAAVASLLAVADEAGAAGFPLAELVALHDALRLGAISGVVERIEDLACRTETRWVAPFVEHATGIRGRDAGRVSKAADAFADLGALLCAADAASQAAALLVGSAPTRSALESTRALMWSAACEGAITPMIGAAPASAVLTAREREVAALAAGGHPSREIATRLSISTRTVDNLLGRVYAKLGIEGRAQLPGILPPVR